MKTMLQKKTVVLIDDEERFAGLFAGKINLWDSSFSVVTNTWFGPISQKEVAAFATHCTEIVAAHREECAAIFLDLGLQPPDADGWQRGFEVGKRLRHAFYDIPILILTSFTDKDREGYFYDFDAFLNKDEFSHLNTTGFLGTLSRAMYKRNAMVENLPHYYQQHAKLRGPTVTMLNAFGEMFSGAGQNLETVLDDAIKIKAYFQEQKRSTVILFADLANSTQLKQTRGFFEGLRTTREHNHVITKAVMKSGGTVVKYIGDAVMARYDYDDGVPVDFRPINAAIEAQEAFLANHRADPKAQPIETKIGMAHGKVADFYGNDPQGTAVDLAARVQSIAQAGQILVTKDLVDLVGLQTKQVTSKAGTAMSFAPRDYFGSVRSESFKGFDHPVDIYEVNWKVEPR